MWINVPINVSMTGLVAASASVVAAGGCSGEAGEAGGRNTKMGEAGGRNSSNPVLLGTCSREALHKIVSSHTSTQVGSSALQMGQVLSDRDFICISQDFICISRYLSLK